jgi:hypothetical protein
MLIRHNILDEAKLSSSLGDVSKLVLMQNGRINYSYTKHVYYILYLILLLSHIGSDLILLPSVFVHRICNFLFVQYISCSLIHLHPFLPVAFLIAVRLVKDSSVLFFFIARTRTNY